MHLTRLLPPHSEFFAEESEDDYWRFLADISVVPRTSDKTEYEHLVSVAERILQSEQKLGLFKISLAINYYNPRLQAFAHMAETTLGSTVRSVCFLLISVAFLTSS
jgi:hypothetical protein